MKTKTKKFILIAFVIMIVSLGTQKLFSEAEKHTLKTKAKVVNYFDMSYHTPEVKVNRTFGVDTRTSMQKFYDTFESDTYFRDYIINMNVKRNNPGNLRCAKQPNSYCDNGFASFPTPLIGFRALIKQLEADISRGDTIETFVKDYAPAFENNTENYIQFICDKTGRGRKTKIAELDVLYLATVIAQKEHSLKF